MDSLKNSMDLLTSIKGVGKNRAETIIAYCGSIYGAAKYNSLLAQNKLPGINNGKMLSEKINRTLCSLQKMY